MKFSRDQTKGIQQAIKQHVGDDIIVAVYNRRRIPKTEDYVMVYQTMAKKVLEGNLCLSTCKVMFYLIANMSFENFIGIHLQTISENINMPLPTVKKAMRELKELGILQSIKDSLDRRHNVYRINPLAAWKGKVKNRQKSIKEDPDQLRIEM